MKYTDYFNNINLYKLTTISSLDILISENKNNEFQLIFKHHKKTYDFSKNLINSILTEINLYEKNLKTLKFGKFGLQSTENKKITYKEVESARVSITQKYKSRAKIWLRFKFTIPLSEKPNVRMGKGKGKISH